MPELFTWIPTGIDVGQPSSARVYDYLLGGENNFPADRALGDKLMAAIPARTMAVQNRAFLRRSVRYLVGQGVRQFIDLGSGIPTAGNVHQIAQQAHPGCRVVYVDIEVAAAAHAKLLLDGVDGVAIVHGDMRDRDGILDSPEVRSLIDLDRPVGLLMHGTLHFLPDADDPWKLVQGYRDRLASGSYLVVSGFTGDGMPAKVAAATKLLENTPNAAYARDHDATVRYFDGFEVVEPGVVYVPLWRPDEHDGPVENASQSNLYAGVGRKP